VRLLIIRHATAVERGSKGIPDDERPLTPRGERRFRTAARGLAAVAPRPDVLLTSPLPRALQTAEIAARAWGRVSAKSTPALAAGDFTELARILGHIKADARVAIVGHEPHLSSLLGRILGGAQGEALTFRKGGAALIDVPGRLEAGGRLIWYLPPRILRKLAG
jgi:phosphohistidine phosphatase